MNFNDMLKKKKKEEVEGVENEVSATDETTGTEGAEATAADTIEQQPAGRSAEEKLKEEIAQANDKYLRLYAEFDNFRRRTRQERADLLLTAGKDVIVDMLPVLDDFERAIRSMEKATDIVAVKEGVALVQHKLKNILGAKGLREMNSTGQPFDADLHEGITSIPAPTDDLKGKVVDELEKGYSLNDKVIRFAKVVVGA